MDRRKLQGAAEKFLAAIKNGAVRVLPLAKSATAKFPITTRVFRLSDRAVVGHSLTISMEGHPVVR